MRKNYQTVTFSFLLFALSLFTALPGLAGEPLVVVVHGIGGGDRQQGWSADIQQAWGLERVEEVTFSYEGRDTISSIKDFAPQAGDWALQVQKQLARIARKNPGRELVVVSHSWGTVTTKMALMGGMGGGTSQELVGNTYQINPMNPGDIKIKEWITLGSPLGRADANVAGNLRQLQVEVPAGKPNVVESWLNVYDPNDPVSNQSHNLAGAINKKVEMSGNPDDWSGLSYHTGIWTNPWVTNHIREVVGKMSLSGVKIKFLDSKTERALDNVRVSLSGPQTAEGTSVKGVAEIGSLIEGTYSFTFQRDGYETQSATRSLKPGEVKTGTIKMVPKANSGIEVKIIDSRDQHPVSGASVRVSGAGNGSATADANGWANVRGLYEGSYTIEISASGYQTLSGQKYIGGDKTARARVLLQPIGAPAKKKTDTTKTGAATNKAKDPNACYAPTGQEISRLRTHNQAQNWQSGNVSTLTLGRDGQCMQQWQQCTDAAQQASKTCSPNARGTYEDCHRKEAKAWVDCAQAELSCEEGKARTACGL